MSSVSIALGVEVCFDSDSGKNEGQQSGEFHDEQKRVVGSD